MHESGYNCIYHTGTGPVFCQKISAYQFNWSVAGPHYDNNGTGSYPWLLPYKCLDTWSFRSFHNNSPAVFHKMDNTFLRSDFVFLAGASIYFQSLRKTKKELSAFLIKRGLWLLIVEIFIFNLAFSFDIQFGVVALQVIWAIGISMIILGFAIWLPYMAFFIAGVIIVFGHNLLDFYEAGLAQSPGWWYDLIHRPGIYTLWPNHQLFIFYPFLPWCGLMMLGYCFGNLFLRFEGNHRKKMLIWPGCTVLLFFVVLRYSNFYGDPDKWLTQKTGLYTFFAFMDVQKYPPSLLFMCATVGCALLFLAFTDKANNRLSRFITVYGRVPFLYYVLHFFLFIFYLPAYFLQEDIHLRRAFIMIVGLRRILLYPAKVIRLASFTSYG